jgi:hypothetical protein
MHISGKEMNALTGNKAVLLIFCSIDINALMGNAQNQTTQNIIQCSLETNVIKLNRKKTVNVSF